MTLREILAWRDQQLRTVREAKRAEEARVRDEADRLIRIAIDEAKSVEPNQNRIARRLGVQSSQLAHLARRLGVTIPTRRYKKKA